MNWWVIFFTAIGLSMDAFAVAVVAGASIRKERTAHAFRIGGSFGFFQMIMPITGWFLGERLRHFIMNIDHWVVFGLLVLIGIKMIHESFSLDENPDRRKMTPKRLLLLSIATSIDAFAVGVSFAFLGYPILLSAALIGLVTFVLATSGVFLGHYCSSVLGKRAEFAGGVVLICIGLKILLDHLKA